MASTERPEAIPKPSIWASAPLRDDNCSRTARSAVSFPRLGSAAKAASAARYPMDKGAHQAAQARNLTSAGKLAEARKLWEELAKNEELPFAQEAQVRLGELAGAGK